MTFIQTHAKRIAVSLLLISLFAHYSRADELFRADFETGDLSQWKQTGTNSVNASERNVQVVTDPVQQGKFAVKITIHPDDVFNQRQLRAQLGGPKVHVQEGSDTFMSFALCMQQPPLDRDNFFYWEGQPPPRWNNVMTWWVEPKGDKTFISYGTGNLGRDGVHWQAEFEIGKWHQLAMHIRWSEDPTKGSVSLWFDGKKVLEKNLKTKGAESVYFCQPGIHRSPHRESIDTIFFDNFILADKLSEVLPEGS
ncbi:MAG: polysaccharide lyase [Planctomycetales bacterium]|nr:polysaccharide lyase [Planctomycetales bacterium]